MKLSNKISMFLGILFIFTNVLLAGFGNVTSSREPFVLELPGITNVRYRKPVIRLPQKSLPSLKFRVVEPFASDINYGKIIITVNGEGINRGCKKTSDLEGKVVVCEKFGKHARGFKLKKGKNIVEIRATNRMKREFYASYLLVLDDKNAVVEKNEWKNGKAELFKGEKYAVIIGVSEYKYQDAGLKNLRYADDDARSIATFLQTPSGGSFSASNVKLLLNGDATLDAVRSSLSEVFESAAEEDLIFVFIAGHGAPDPLASQNLYFLLTDTKVVDMQNTAFPMGDLKEMLENEVIAERVIVMIDTCHSAGVNQKTQSLVTGRDLIQESDENNITNFYLTKQLYNETGRAILTSSDVNEVSQESSKWGNHGVFTWALLEGLKGKADYNKDTLITMGEIFQFTRASVQKETKFKQNPRALPGTNKDLTLAFTKAK